MSIPVFLQNDATAACNAELVFGDGPHPRHFACFFMAFFIGGGLVLNGSLYSGARGNAAGFGPLLVPDLDGEMRPLIDLASLSSLEIRLREAGGDPRQIWRTAEAWDIPAPVLDGWMAQASHALAHAILATQTMLDLEAVLLDGWLPRDILLQLVQRVAARLDMLDMTGMYRPEVLCGTIGADARSLGAASLPLSARFLTE
jgi:predicted NBD/HSP70 family sugar kinase